MRNFKVGEKVVCVEPINGLIENEIYTVRGMYISTYDPSQTAIYLEEIIGKYSVFHGKELGYRSSRFRKLDHQFSEDVIAEIIKQVKEESLTLAN